MKEKHVSLYLEVCCDPKDMALVEEIVGAIFGSERVIITFHHDHDYFEYYGIDRVWRLSQENPMNKTLYFHSKGISHNVFSVLSTRNVLGTKLFDIVVRPWRKVLDIFEAKPTVDKIGALFNKRGLMWWNFFWIRGLYCNKLEKPIRTKRRHYYEDWIVRHPRQSRDEDDDSELALHDLNYDTRFDNCYRLVDEKSQKPVSSTDANDIKKCIILRPVYY
jgi:hypothetical protein